MGGDGRSGMSIPSSDWNFEVDNLGEAGQMAAVQRAKRGRVIATRGMVRRESEAQGGVIDWEESSAEPTSDAKYVLIIL